MPVPANGKPTRWSLPVYSIHRLPDSWLLSRQHLTVLLLRTAPRRKDAKAGSTRCTACSRRTCRGLPSRKDCVGWLPLRAFRLHICIISMYRISHLLPRPKEGSRTPTQNCKLRFDGARVSYALFNPVTLREPLSARLGEGGKADAELLVQGQTFRLRLLLNHLFDDRGCLRRQLSVFG